MAEKQAICSYCGIVVDLFDGEAMTIFLSEMTAFVYHGWCFEPALERAVIIFRPTTKQEGPYDRDQEDADGAAEGSTGTGGSGVGATEGRHPHDE